MHWVSFRIFSSAGGALALSVAAAAQGGMTPLKMTVPPAVATAVKVSGAGSSQVLHISLTMQPPSLSAFQAFDDQVSDPTNAMYGKFLTPAQVGQKFGQSPANVTAVVNYLKTKGFTVNLIGKNNLSILATGTVAQAQSAFGVTINDYHTSNPGVGGRADFYSYSTVPELPSAMAAYVTYISGLQNFTKPVPRSRVKLQAGGQTLTPNQTHVLYNLQPLYSKGFQGQGRTVAISSFDGFSLTNVPLYYTQYALPAPAGGVLSNVKVETIDGGSENGPEGGEGDLDIQMVLGQAPLCNLIIYDGGGDLMPVLTQEADDNAADMITESYGWDYDATQAEAAHTIHLQLTAQGQTYMLASGDTGTDIAPEPYSYGDYDTELTNVGGTVPTFQADGTRITEVGWGGGDTGASSGGWVTTPVVPYNTLPSWQKGKGVPTNINFRLIPDVALAAAGSNTTGAGAFYFYYDNELSTGDGTSFSSPVFTGSLADVEQRLISIQAITQTNGLYRLGRINDRIYQENGRSDVWFDILTGTNGSLPNGQVSECTPGWDFVTGWGAINFNSFVAAFAIPFAIDPASVAVFSGQGQSPTGTVQSLLAVDNSDYIVSSVPNAVGAIAGAQVTFTSPRSAANVFSMTLNVTVSAPTAVTNFLYLYNYTTSTYDLVSTGPMNGSNSSISVAVSNPANYISSSDKIIVVDRGVYPSRLGSVPFKLKLDQVVIQATGS